MARRMASVGGRRGRGNGIGVAIVARGGGGIVGRGRPLVDPVIAVCGRGRPLGVRPLLCDAFACPGLKLPGLDAARKMLQQDNK